MTLDQLLVTAIDSPERFSDQAVYEETLRYYFIGRDIEEPGPLLSSQLDELQALLENSQVPVRIVFLSDTFTEVTLLRIGYARRIFRDDDGSQARQLCGSWQATRLPGCPRGIYGRVWSNAGCRRGAV